MDYLVHLGQGKLHDIAHFIHEVGGVSGDLYSPQPKLAVGEQSQSGQWDVVTALPPGIKICLACQRRKQKLDNPLPARVEKELELLAHLDPRAAARQREKMLAHYGG